ncbi:MAG: SPOR domain-containing protein [Roseobacter sp.]
MADIEFSHGVGDYGRDAMEDAGVPKTQSLMTLTNVAGAAVSLALIAGVGVWGYKLMIRDVSGIPVVRALDSEMRVRPEDPGGQLARHQGLAVNEIAARGEASGPVDQITLAPNSVALSAADQPVVLPKALSPAATYFDTEQHTAAPTFATASPSSANRASDDQQDAINDIVTDLLTQTKPLSSLDGPKVVSARTTTATDAQGENATITSVIDGPGMRQSARPRLRPKDIQAFIRPAAFAPAAEIREIDAAAIPSGTRLAQLGAFDSPDVAREEWSRLQSRFGEILTGKSRVVQEAQSGGRTFYRLRAMGFVDLSDTRRFCSAVKAEGVDCIPVQVK